MLKLLIVALVVVAVAADYDTDWAVFKAKYNKKYNPEVEVLRMRIWIENMKAIEKHNELYSKGLSTYYLGENEYSDMTNTELVSKMNGLKMPPRNVRPSSPSYVDVSSLPKTVDWRKKGYVTPVKNQGQCGSCWAFSTTGTIEGQHFNATGNLVSLSESNLVDCSDSYGNAGCDGGWPYQAMEYVIANKGIDTETSYPYVAEDQQCHYSSSSIGATISNYRQLPSGSEADLQKATAEVGPISVCIDASHESFHQYKGGVYNDKQCSNTSLDHAVLVVGYGTYESTPYWMVKNSWGTSFGIDGYIMMIRDHDNRCGIATAASYPIV